MASGLNGSLAAVTHQVENILRNNDTFVATLALTEEEVEKQLYHEIRVEPLGPLRADAIFYYLSRDSYKNCITLSKKGHDMACSSVTNNIVTPNSASNALYTNWYQSECLNTPPRQSEASRCTSAHAWSSTVLIRRGGSKYGQCSCRYAIY